MSVAIATKWAVDPTHSEVQFKVKHLVISTVTGTFNSFSGGLTTSGDPTEESDDFDGAEIHFSLDVASIDTNQEMRDAHLRSADFFDADQYPHITFQSTSFRKVKGDQYHLSGDLTIRSVTKPVEWNVEYGGSANDSFGNKKVGFEVSGKINRKEFALTWDSLTETGGLVLSEDIKLIANIQLTQQV